jgi:TonB-dependent SusC/RagA subfamily outer membrane receptor
LAQRVTIHLTNVALKRAIDSVSRVAKVVVEYRLPLIKEHAKHITVNAVGTPLGVVLEQVLSGTGLHVVPGGPGSLTIVASREAYADSVPTGGTVGGRVVDSASGRGLGGATIKVSGTKVSAITSDSGNFTLQDIPAGDHTLMVRLFGYRAAERSVTVTDGGRTTARILLSSVPTVLSGVVTTATGQQRKIELGNDITTINVDSVMRVARVMTVTDLLETRVPGLTVLHSSGDPGNPSRLRLRGVGSISGNNDPIFIVDGVRVYSSQSDSRNNNLAPSAKFGNGYANVPSGANSPQIPFSAPSPIDQIDPNSIETIEVFKGPSASALYGSDAANGVIVITTKRGRAGPTHWNLALGQGVNWIPGKWPDNYFRFGYSVNGFGPLCNWDNITCGDIDSVRTFQALNDSRYTVLSRGGDQSATLTISGGVSALQYSLTGTGTATQGNLKLPAAEQERYVAQYGPIPRWMMRPDHYNTWGVNGSLTARPNETLQLTLASSVYNSAQQTSPLQAALPLLQGVYISGGNAIYPAFGEIGSGGTVRSLADYALVNNYVQRVTEDGVTSANTLSLSWQPRPWLPISATGGLQNMQRTGQTYIPFGVSTAGPDGCYLGGCDTTGFYGLGRGLSNNRTVTVGTTLPVLRHIMVALGGNYYSASTSDFQGAVDQLAPGISSPASFLIPGCFITEDHCGIARQSSSSNATYGYYLEPRLNVRSRFFVSPGFRFDGGSGGTHAGSLGGAAGGLSAFPKLDFSYIAVDRQSDAPLWGFLTLLRPRVAFGLAGTQPSPEQRLRLLNVTQSLSNGGRQGKLCAPTIILEGTSVPAVCLSTLGNTQLHPERSRELEGGFEATLWRGRFNVTYTQYNKTRKDAILNIPIAPSVSQPSGGSFTIAENIGEVRNTGTEMTGNIAVFQQRAFSWNVGLNLSKNNNVLVHLNPGHAPDYQLGLIPGYPLFGQWTAPLLAFSDLNSNGTIEQSELSLGDSLVYQGQPNPKYTLNLNSDVHLLNGRLGITATLQYQNGMTQTNQAALSSQSFLLIGNNPNTPLAYQAAIIAATRGVSKNGQPLAQGRFPTSSYGLIQTVNTLRFDALSVNYELPRQASAWLRFPRAAVAVQGSNLGLHTNYRGKDPNVNAFSTVSAGDQTLDLGQIPEPRTWRLKLTLGN